MASKLIQRGANVNQVDYKSQLSQTLLIQAINTNQINMVRFLLDHGAYPHIEDMSGLDACDYARMKGIAINYPELQNCIQENKIPPYKVDELLPRTHVVAKFKPESLAFRRNYQQMIDTNRKLAFGLDLVEKKDEGPTEEEIKEQQEKAKVEALLKRFIKQNPTLYINPTSKEDLQKKLDNLLQKQAEADEKKRKLEAEKDSDDETSSESSSDE